MFSQFLNMSFGLVPAFSRTLRLLGICRRTSNATLLSTSAGLRSRLHKTLSRARIYIPGFLVPLCFCADALI